MSARFATAAALLLMLIGSGCGAASAASSTSRQISTGERFAAGEFEGTALDAEGRVRLAPQATTLWGPDEGIVWELDGDGQGGALVALSNPSRVLHVAPGETETWFVSNRDGALITSLVADGEGGAWFGVAPDGYVMHAANAASTRPVAKTGSIFVWALARDASGALWIGTGVPGALFRQSGSDELERLFETGDDPIRSIVVDPSGGVIVGTGGRGRVIRVAADGTAFVLHDADESEIVDLVRREDGTVFALAASSGVQINPAGAPAERTVDATVRVTASAPSGEAPRDEKATDAARASSRPKLPSRRMQVSPGAALYRIDPDGHVVRIWRSATQAPFSLAAAGEGVVIGTGDDGRLIAVDELGRDGRLLQLASHQVSALRRLPDGSLLAGGTGDARLVRLETGTRRAGQYTTPPIDAGRPASWGRIAWEAELPRGGSLTASVRAGNTDAPDETWSDWVEVDEGSAPRGLPSTRWLQLRFELASSRRGPSPAISAASVHYRPRNRPPALDSIEVHPPGVVWTRPPAPANAPRGPRIADDPVARRIVGELGRPQRTPTVRKGYEVGVRTVSWVADDQDGDRLVFDLDLRREGDSSWLLLARDVDDVFLSWDARAVDDGRYRIRVRARDAADNPADEQLDDVRISATFRVDTSAPSLGTPRIEREPDGWVVEFEASDAGGGEIAAAEMSLDGGPWRPLRASDGVADSTSERFVVRVTQGHADRGRSLRVRVADAAGNLTGATWLLTEQRR